MSQTTSGGQSVTMKAINEDRLTRVVLVDYRKGRDGRVGDWDNLVYEQWDLSVEIGVQDDGRTLKIWVRDPGTPKWPTQETDPE